MAASRSDSMSGGGRMTDGSESTVRIGLVLPDVMGTYGDGGNALVLRQRLRMRGHDAEIVEITLSDPVPESLDIYTLGGAEDSAQRLATRHLQRYPGLQRAAAKGAPVLAICAAIQVLGHWYETSTGERVDGVGLIDVTTSPQAKRAIGEVTTTPPPSPASKTTVAERNSAAMPPVSRTSPAALAMVSATDSRV
jgi:CobQ-like glutamine amidotransferase family enzyme